VVFVKFNVLFHVREIKMREATFTTSPVLFQTFTLPAFFDRYVENLSRQPARFNLPNGAAVQTFFLSRRLLCASAPCVLPFLPDLRPSWTHEGITNQPPLWKYALAHIRSAETPSFGQSLGLAPRQMKTPTIVLVFLSKYGRNRENRPKPRKNDGVGL
jgi:hypothetical protein